MSRSRKGNKICNNDPAVRRRLLLAFVAGLVSAAAAPAQQQAIQPKLVLGIIVDDLKNEYITLLRDNFTAGGFNRLLNNGVVIPNADYGTPLDATAATALLYTGTGPSVNGIPSDEIFDRTTLRGIPVFTDSKARGVNTDLNLSPASLQVTTITDELKIAGGGVTYSYAIAPDPAKALIMAGHAGNCGIWLNDVNEQWATTNFYRDVPTTVGLHNRNNTLRSRIDTIAWTPLYPAEKYQMLPEHLTFYTFKYVFKQSGPDKMEAFKNSPKMNDEITSFAIDNIEALRLGAHSNPDMLSLAYTLEPYEYSRTTDNRYELIDAYYRLDRNLEQLFDAVDKKVGLDSALIFLAATPPNPRERRDDDHWQLPYGEFSTRKAMSLLNLYLIAKFGNGDWTQGYHNGQIFLNHTLADERNLCIEDLRLEAARFLVQMAGVNNAYTINEIVESHSPDMAAMRQNMVLGRSGDVVLNIMPGWQIVDDFNNPKKRTDKVERAVATTAPVYIMGPNVQPRKIITPVDARAIAPTITSLLRIRAPNAAGTAPLSLD